MTGPTYAGFNGSLTHPNPQDLTSAGSTDWKIWGQTTTSLAGDDHKSAGAGISDLTNIDPAPSIPLRALGNLGLGVGTGQFTVPFSFMWADGTAAASASTTLGGLQHNNSTSSVTPGYGFSFTVPATIGAQRLSLWVSAHHGTGRLTATLGAVTQTDIGIAGGQNHGGVYTIVYAGDGTPGQTLQVSYVLDSALNPANPDPEGGNNTEANVVIYAAALTTAPTPVLYQAIPVTGSQVKVSGRISASPSTLYELTVKTATTCVAGALGSGASTLGTFSATTDAAGDAYFQGLVPIGAGLKTYVTAEVSGPGGLTSDPSTCIVGGPDNDTWPRALTIGAGSATGFIDDAGRARWYKVAIQPGSKIHVDLTNLPADYDVFVFKDIGQAFTALANTTDLTRLSAEFAPSAFSPSAFSPSAFSPSAFSPSAFSPSAFSPSAFSPSAFSPSAFSPSAFSPSAFSPSAFSPSAFSPSAFSPSAFSPSAFSPSAFSPSAFSADTYASVQIRSLIAGSALVGTASETVVADTWNNTGFYYIRVSGKNGASSITSPFTLGVSLDASVCDGVAPQAGSSLVVPTGIKTLVLRDTSRMAANAANSASDMTALDSKLDTFIARPEIAGYVVDVGAQANIVALNAQAESHKSCMYAKNLVASAIHDIVTAYRTANPNLKYIVIVGGDGVIPFFRYPDQSLLGPESAYADPLITPVTTGTASDASLQSNYVLGQDAYGASIDLSLHASTFPIPDLPVGRLVETASEASGILDAYLSTTNGVVATPTSSLVTGYDFLADAASSVNTDLAAGMGTGGTASSLISAKDTAPGQVCDATHQLPDCSWNATVLSTSLLGSRHDLIFLAGHFSANNALAADFSTTLTAGAVAASAVNLTNSIVFSAGCHSGYNVVDPDARSGAELDWAQALARKQATLIAGTGYQYGDTDFLEYSERIYAEFAHQLRIGSGPVSIGDALMRSKQIYLANTPDIRGLHEKALLESSIFGLPMLSVDLPTAGRVPATTPGSIASPSGFGTNPGLTLGLKSANTTISSTLTSHSVPMTNLDGGTATATYYSGGNGVVTNPGEPAIPLETRNVTVANTVLRGVGLRGGSYADQTVTPLTGAPADPEDQIRGIHHGFGSPVFFPMRLWTPNYYDALTGGTTNLLVTPAQHKTTGASDGSVILRTYSNVDLRLFYSAYTGPAAKSGAPTILGVNAVVVGGNVTFSARAVGDPSAGMQQVWVTYTGQASAWASVDLVQSTTDSTLWSKTMPLPAALSGRSIEYMVQAVNGVGLVSLDDNVGRYYALGKRNQTITFADVPVKTYGDADFPIVATATSGLAVTYAKTGAACSLTGSTVHIVAAGSCTVTASQAGDADWFAASDISKTIVVQPANQTITITAPPSKTFGDADFTVSATSNAGLTPVTFSTTSTGCTVSATGTVHIVDIGPCAVVASQAGNANYNPATATATVQVIWPFTGFFQPVDNPGTTNILNTVTAGSAVPIKFSLGGNRGVTSVLATNSPIVTTFACPNSAPLDEIETTVAASTSGLQYDATSNQYTYVWKTVKGQTGCRQVNVKLRDGTDHIALFKFK